MYGRGSVEEGGDSVDDEPGGRGGGGGGRGSAGGSRGLGGVRDAPSFMTPTCSTSVEEVREAHVTSSAIALSEWIEPSALRETAAPHILYENAMTPAVYALPSGAAVEEEADAGKGESTSCAADLRASARWAVRGDSIASSSLTVCRPLSLHTSVNRQRLMYLLLKVSSK